MLLPEPPVCSFASDNAAGVSPEVMEALVAANTPAALAYGDDRWTAEAVGAFRDLVRRTGRGALGVGRHRRQRGGTGLPAPAVAGGDLCRTRAHIVVDECGAPARFTGATIVPVARRATASSPPPRSSRTSQWQGSEHHPQPAVISISQVTEHGHGLLGRRDRRPGRRAHGHGLTVHLDGARIANAVVATGAGLPTMIRDTGVDVMTFGATKNGAMYGEAVVFLRPELARDARFVRKQAGQLPSKARFVAAQMTGAARRRALARQRSTRQRHGAPARRPGLAGIPGVTI